MRSLRILPIAAVFLLARSGAGTPSAAVALLPFENLSAAPEAASVFSSLVASGIRSRGWTLIDGAAVETALDASRVRYLDSIATDVRPKLAAAMNAPVLAQGAVYAFDAGPDPRVALALRLVA